jgi:hypothetical protein
MNDALKQALKGLGSTITGAMVVALASWAADPANVQAFLAALPAKYAFLSVLGGVISSVAVDYLRHRETK